MKKIINILFNKAKSFIRIVRIELDLRFGIPYNYFGKKIFASKQKYLEIFEVAKNEKLVVNTASPLQIPLAIRGINKASVPDAHDIQYLTPTYLANLRSNSNTF